MPFTGHVTNFFLIPHVIGYVFNNFYCLLIARASQTYSRTLLQHLLIQQFACNVIYSPVTINSLNEFFILNIQASLQLYYNGYCSS